VGTNHVDVVDFGSHSVCVAKDAVEDCMPFDLDFVDNVADYLASITTFKIEVFGELSLEVLNSRSKGFLLGELGEAFGSRLSQSGTESFSRLGHGTVGVEQLV